MGVLYQVLGTGIACYLCMSMGLMFAWPSSTFTLFVSNTTVLNRPMTDTEQSLFGSLSSIGALISTPFAGYGLDILGRKNCAFAGSLTHVVAWSLIAAFHQVEVILLAVFISGVGGAVFLVVPVFIGEICQESIRGSMTSGSMVFYGVGLFLSYLLGGLLAYKTMIYICLTMAVVGVAMLTILRETPMYLMKKGNEEAAIKSMAFYRNANPGSKIVLQEMEKVRRALNPDLDEDSNTTPEEEKLKPVEEKPREKVSLLQFIKKSRSTRKAIFVTLTLGTAAVFQGLVVVQVYAEPLFRQAVPNIPTTLCCVLLAVVTVVAGCIAAYLTDVAGRKPLMVYSSIASGICCVLLGTQLQFQWSPHWMTAVFIYMFTATYTFGAGTVPFVLVAEVFLPEIKSFMSMLVIEWAWLCNFTILFIFNPLVAAFGLGLVFYFFATICFLSSIFSMIYQPETKGIPVDVIQLKFAGRRAQ